MSLIQDALKRQHDDLGSSGQPPPAVDKTPTLKLKPEGGHAEEPAHDATTPPTPPELPRAQSLSAHAAINETRVVAQLPQIPVAPPRRSRTPVLIFGVVTIIAFLGVGVWLYFNNFTNSPVPIPPVAPKPVITLAPPATSAAPVVVTTVPVIPAVVQPTQQVVQLPVVLPTNIPVTTVITPVIPAVSVPPSKAPAEVAAPVAPVVWPMLKVNMLLKTSKTAVAKINNSELSVGDEIEGVQIIAIESDSVTLRFNGVTRKARAGSIVQ